MNQLEQVKEHLNKFGTITSWRAIRDYRITRLSEYIRQLREKGMDIKTEWGKSERGKPYGIYKLEKELP